MTRQLLASLACVAVVLTVGSGALNAQLTAAEAARLGKDLTPLGAEKAGNADGTIPAWEGGITKAPARYVPGKHHVDPFAADQVLFTINGENADTYAAKLTPGQVALLKTYPTYKMHVYPTRRSASLEAAFVDVGRGRNAVLYAGEVNWSAEDLEGAPPRIEKVLKSGQSVLVQVTKDPIGGKGARLTAQISMPGRYLVLVPNSTVTGISRRLPEDERKRLKAIYKKIKPDAHGLIVRTAAEGASEEALTAADLSRLVAEWETIEKRSKKAKAPAVLYEEPELTVRAVRDLFTDEEFKGLVTDSPRVHGKVIEYLSEVAPDLAEKVHRVQLYVIAPPARGEGAQPPAARLPGSGFYLAATSVMRA